MTNNLYYFWGSSLYPFPSSGKLKILRSCLEFSAILMIVGSFDYFGASSTTEAGWPSLLGPFYFCFFLLLYTFISFSYFSPLSGLLGFPSDLSALAGARNTRYLSLQPSSESPLMPKSTLTSLRAFSLGAGKYCLLGS